MTEAESIPPDHSTAFAPDRVVRLVATDGYQVHRLIYEALAKDGVRDFLFAPFPAADGLHAVLVRSCDARTSFAEGQRFRMTLRAMPSVKMAGRRRSIGAARSKDSLRLRWIHARARANGFTLLSDPEMRVERVRMEEAKIPFAFNACIYRAPICVTEPAKFTMAYVGGLGQGRAWGCGMIVLRDA